MDECLKCQREFPQPIPEKKRLVSPTARTNSTQPPQSPHCKQSASLLPERQGWHTLGIQQHQITFTAGKSRFFFSNVTVCMQPVAAFLATIRQSEKSAVDSLKLFSALATTLSRNRIGDGVLEQVFRGEVETVIPNDSIQFYAQGSKRLSIAQRRNNGPWIRENHFPQVNNPLTVIGESQPEPMLRQWLGVCCPYHGALLIPTERCGLWSLQYIAMTMPRKRLISGTFSFLDKVLGLPVRKTLNEPWNLLQVRLKRMALT